MSQKALSIKQPWAWSILHGGKDVENRTWQTAYRGRLWVHAGRDVARTSATEHDPVVLARQGLAAGQLHRSALLGHVELVGIHHWDDCHDSGHLCSTWAVPDGYHWVLTNPVLLPEPITMGGRLGLWDVPDDVVARHG